MRQHYLMSEELANGLLQYLSTRPYIEAAPFIEALRSLPAANVTGPTPGGASPQPRAKPRPKTATDKA